MTTENNTIYVSPKVKTVEIKAQYLICGSPNGGTEGYSVSNNNYDDSDFE